MEGSAPTGSHGLIGQKPSGQVRVCPVLPAYNWKASRCSRAVEIPLHIRRCSLDHRGCCFVLSRTCIILYVCSSLQALYRRPRFPDLACMAGPSTTGLPVDVTGACVAATGFLRPHMSLLPPTLYVSLLATPNEFQGTLKKLKPVDAPHIVKLLKHGRFRPGIAPLDFGSWKLRSAQIP